MNKIRILISILFIAAFLTGCASLQIGESRALGDDPKLTDDPSLPAWTQAPAAVPPIDCPVTLADTPPYVAPDPLSPEPPWPGIFWHGSDYLWTALPANGVWASLPHNPDGYTQKIMWWSTLFDLSREPEPALVVTGRRLDAEAPALKFHGATNAFADDIGEAMLTGVDFPTLGCWEVTGQYKKSELTFVVWLAP